ncbi:MAG: hypothetical protein LBK47_06615 [Prevotellaceae bacterium]|jgi:hypothetical protein|nr:hypothetical protein [Prevotellaceae bacterium]
METITLPIAFLESVGNLALEAQRLALRFMPYIMMLVFTFGLVSFLLGSTKGKLDFTRYVFTPMFLYLLIVSYPTAIDVTGKLYGIAISVFDKPEYKNFYLKYAGVEEELKGYKSKAKTEMDNYTLILKKDKREHADKASFLSIKSEAEKEAHRLAEKEVEQKLKELKNLSGGETATKIWDFFKLPVVRIIRYVVDLVRNLALSFLVVVGCLAIMFECIPAFRGILSKWFKFYTAVTFWALTVCVLDAAFLSFAESGVASAKHFTENATVLETWNRSDNNLNNMMDSYNKLYNRPAAASDIITATDFAIKWYAYGGSQGLNTAVSVVMVIFYCLVPYLTSLYIGGEQAGMFMSKVIGVGSMATQQILQTGTGAASSTGGTVGAGVGGQKGAAVGRGIGGVVGAVGGTAGIVTSAGGGQ